MIRFESVAKRYNDAVALHPVSFDLPRRKTTVLIGPSGGGKSTVLRLIAGLIRPTAGCIYVDEHELRADTLQPYRRRLGYVIQDGGLFPHLTARRNVLLAADELKLPARETGARLESLCALVRLGPAELARYPLELSGGQRQRVSLIRALMLKPDLLLLDEPLGALDAIVRAALLVDLKTIFERLACTVVLVTHDLAEASHFADHVILLNAGRIVQQGSLEDLRRAPAAPFVTEFFDAQRLITSA
jgi:osmoprotectant transport system ATP-binding protein